MKHGAALWCACFLLALAVVPLLLAAPERSPEKSPQKSSQDYLREHVAYLSDHKPARNHRNIASLDRAADYIARKLRETTREVRFQKFRANERRYQNVIARYPGTSAKRIVLGAHYDVAGNTPGADDNASSVAVLLEVAFLIQERLKAGQRLPHAVDLVFYSLEEPPYFRTESMGSFIHASDLARRKVPLELMISLDCVGYYSDEPGSQSFPVKGMGLLYPDRGNYLAVVGKTGQGGLVKRVQRHLKGRLDFGVETITAPASLAGIDFSDHLNYWKFDYPALMLSDTALYRNPNYHRPGDLPATLDYAKMDALARGLVHMLFDWRRGARKKN